jgi:hypothetical protein
MSTYRVFQFVTFISTLAITFYACGVTGSGGYC